MAGIRRRFVYFAIGAATCIVLWLGWGNDANPLLRSGPLWKEDTYIWRTVEQHHPLTRLRPLPSKKPRPLPAVQAKFPSESAEAQVTRLRRQTIIKNAFLRCWNIYKARAWLHDEVSPVSLKFKDPFGGWGATLVDSLDTLWIMGLRSEFAEAVDAVHSRITFNATTADTISVFETSIRFLGGLLSAYDLSGDIRLLSKARDVGDMLVKAFDTPNHLPVPRWDVHAAMRGQAQEAPGQILLAELGSFAMEFTRLSLLTRDAKYYEIVARITDLLDDTQMRTKVPGLWPTKVGTTKATLDDGDEYTLGAEADSTYEYLAKMVALVGGQAPQYEAMYERSIEAAARYLFYRPLTPGNEDVLVSGTVRSSGAGETPRLDTSAQHLSCFAGGMLAVGGRLTGNDTHVQLADKLARGCVWLYRAVPLGIMPEACRITACPSPKSCDWDRDRGLWHTGVLDRWGTGGFRTAEEIISDERLPVGYTEIQAPYYILRPEAIESVFVLYRVTGETDLMDRGWDMWTAIDKATRTEMANSALLNVSPPPGQEAIKSDSMESFWLSETLKYFYLLYSEPELISLDEWVFNTEAHPLRRLKPR